MFVFSKSGAAAPSGDASVARTAALFFGFLALLRAAPFVISKLRPATF